MQNKKLKDGREDPEDDDMSEDDSDENEDPDVNSNNVSDVIDEVTNKTFMSKLSIKRKDKEKVVDVYKTFPRVSRITAETSDAVYTQRLA